MIMCMNTDYHVKASNFLKDPILANGRISGPEVIKLFSCSTQLSKKFQQLLLIKTKIQKSEVSCF